MNSGRIASLLVVLAVFCVLSIFFFPGIEGPYPAVHGPVTALLSLRAAARLRMALRAGVNAIRMYINSAVVASLLFSLKAATASDAVPSSCPSADRAAILRC